MRFYTNTCRRCLWPRPNAYFYKKCVLLKRQARFYPVGSGPSQRPSRYAGVFNVSLFSFTISRFDMPLRLKIHLVFMTGFLGWKALSPASGVCFWDLMRFSGCPFRLVAEGKPSILLKDFDAFYKKTQFYLRNFMFLTSGSLLGSLGHPWEPLGPPSVRIVFLLSTLRVLLGGFWSSCGTIFTFLLFVCHVFSFLACSFHFFSCMFSW